MALGRPPEPQWATAAALGSGAVLYCYSYYVFHTQCFGVCSKLRSSQPPARVKGSRELRAKSHFKLIRRIRPGNPGEKSGRTFLLRKHIKHPKTTENDIHI